MTMAWTELSRTQLETEMSPSRWNPTKTADTVMTEYLHDSAKYTNEARIKIPHRLNIPYGPEPSQKYDLYGTNLPDDALIFVYIHGGYWQEGSKDIAGGIALLNHDLNIKTVVFGYILAPQATIVDMESALRQALVGVIKNSSDNLKLIIGGHSAGAQLTASLLHTAQLEAEIARAISGVVLISGVFDLRPLVHTTVNEPLNLSEDEAAALSPLLSEFNDLVNFESLESLVLVGEFDSPEFHRQSSAYFDKLGSKAAKTSWYTAPGDDHFTIVQNTCRKESGVYRILHSFLDAFATRI